MAVEACCHVQIRIEPGLVLKAQRDHGPQGRQGPFTALPPLAPTPALSSSAIGH